MGYQQQVMPPSSMGVSGPPGGMMMGPNNPYGPSGPPPPGLSSQHPGIPPGMGMRQSPSYPSVWSSSAPPHGHLPPPPQGGMPPKLPPSRSNMTNTQLQQLSAQMKAYRMLARNIPPPEALMSIVHGRKPTQAMLASFNKAQTGAWTGGSSPHGSGGGGGAGGQSAQSPNPSPGPGGNINLYPPSPSLSQSQGGSPKTPQQQGTTSSVLMRSTSATSINSISSAPNVTISSNSELPLPVRQAISAAQTGSASSTAVTSQPLSTMAASSSSTMATNAAASGKAMVKLVKLGPPGKPMGIDPLVIARERENR